MYSSYRKICFLNGQSILLNIGRAGHTKIFSYFHALVIQHCDKNVMIYSDFGQLNKQVLFKGTRIQSQFLYLIEKSILCA